MYAHLCFIICTITYTNVRSHKRPVVSHDKRYISDYSSKSFLFSHTHTSRFSLAGAELTENCFTLMPSLSHRTNTQIFGVPSGQKRRATAHRVWAETGLRVRTRELSGGTFPGEARPESWALTKPRSSVTSGVTWRRRQMVRFFFWLNENSCRRPAESWRPESRRSHRPELDLAESQ